MDKDFVLEMANAIKDQLVGMTPLNVIRSWGIENFVADGCSVAMSSSLTTHWTTTRFICRTMPAQSASARKCISTNLAVSLMKPSSGARTKPSINGFFGRNVFHKRTTYDYKNIYAPIHRGCP